MSENINYDKYKNAVLYFIQNCNNSYLGATKLNKLLYYFDFISFRDRQVSVTGDRYINKEFGPVPHAIDDILGMLTLEGKMKLTAKPYKSWVKYSFEASSTPDCSSFDEYELNKLEYISKHFYLWSTPKIVEQTHLEAPWFYSKLLEEVDYQYASDIDIDLEDVVS